MRLLRNPSSIWTALLIDREQCQTNRDWDRLVRQVHFWRAVVLGLLLGFTIAAAVIRHWSPEPGQRHQIRILWETITTEPPAAASKTGQFAGGAK